MVSSASLSRPVAGVEAVHFGQYIPLGMARDSADPGAIVSVMGQGQTLVPRALYIASVTVEPT